MQPSSTLQVGLAAPYFVLDFGGGGLLRLLHLLKGISQF